MKSGYNRKGCFMKDLSDKQMIVFEYIRKVIGERGVSPSVREIGQAVGLRSTSSVQYNLDILEKAGYIIRDPNLKRTIRLTGSASRVEHIPLLGTVTAGMPILATQYIEEYIPIADMNASGQLFALHVSGDSMINAHILDGDLVVIEQSPVAENGDIVVALLEDEATVKRFYKEKGHFRLQPENEKYEPIIVDEVILLGKVKMVIRNL